jgi:hypothetical protein
MLSSSCRDLLVAALPSSCGDRIFVSVLSRTPNVSFPRECGLREVLGNIADNLKKRGWSYGYVSTVDCQGRGSGELDVSQVRADAGPPRKSVALRSAFPKTLRGKAAVNPRSFVRFNHRVTAFDSRRRTEWCTQRFPFNRKSEPHLSESMRGSAHNRLPDLSLGTQAQRRALQKLSSPNGAV